MHDRRWQAALGATSVKNLSHGADARCAALHGLGDGHVELGGGAGLRTVHSAYKISLTGGSGRKDKHKDLQA